MKARSTAQRIGYETTGLSPINVGHTSATVVSLAVAVFALRPEGP